jgi:hypothetical protein
MHPKLSAMGLSIALAIGAFVCFGVFQLYAAWIDGKRQKVRDHGQHPVTLPNGEVEAKEDIDG